MQSHSILNCPHPRRFFGSRSKYRWYRFLSGSLWPIQFRSRCLILGHAHCCIHSLLPNLHNYFMDIINNNALSQLIDQPTRLTNTLDLVLTNRPGKNCPHPRRFFGSRSKYRWYRFLSGSFCLYWQN
jgi:hypothetical protein